MYKKIIKIFVAAVLSSAIIGCNTQSGPSEASINTLRHLNGDLDSVFNELKSSYETFEPAKMDFALEGLNSYIDKASAELKDMKIENGCQQIHKAMLEKVETMRGIAAKDAKELVRIYKIPDSDFTPELRQQWDNISASADNKMKDVNAKVNQAFAETSNPKTQAK